MFTAVLFDVDGTLVDSNDAHAHAWVAAFAEAGMSVDFHRVRRYIGMGADKLLPTAAGLQEDEPKGKAISKRRGEILLSESLPRLRRQRDADRLLLALKQRGLTLVVATAFRCGGWSDDELKGAIAIYDGPWDLLAGLDTSHLADSHGN